MAMANTAVQVRERPIIFGAESVRAIFDGSKTQTRRVFKFPKHMEREGSDWVKSIQEDGGGNWIPWSTDAPGVAEFTKRAYPNGEGIPCPYGKPGDRLWVREAYHVTPLGRLHKDRWSVCYAADEEGCNVSGAWANPMFMPRWASRIDLELTAVRVERLQDITGNDAREEGVCRGDTTPRSGLYRINQYREAWDRLNAKRGFGWDSNPFVWCISFRRID